VLNGAIWFFFSQSYLTVRYPPPLLNSMGLLSVLDTIYTQFSVQLKSYRVAKRDGWSHRLNLICVFLKVRSILFAFRLIFLGHIFNDFYLCTSGTGSGHPDPLLLSAQISRVLGQRGAERAEPMDYLVHIAKVIADTTAFFEPTTLPFVKNLMRFVEVCLNAECVSLAF
jgi:hypothetical protein